jgi:hypothetical protein
MQKLFRQQRENIMPLAYIHWIDAGAHPEHPIAPGGLPGVPTHPIYYPPYPSQGPGFPTHPIAPGGPPLGIWGPIGNYPDAGFPGPQPGGPVGIWGGSNTPFPTPPIYIPITPPPESGLSPEHPIYIPVQPPLGIWGPTDPRPTNPIVNPGDPGGENAKAKVVAAVKQAVDFWTGNLPPTPGTAPAPVKK